MGLPIHVPSCTSLLALARPDEGVRPSQAAIAAAVVTMTLLAAGCTPAPDAEVCPDGEVKDAATGGCLPERCGTGPWGSGEPEAGTIHVAPWGTPDGDGSQERPMASVQEGADAAAAAGGAVVAVAAGTWTTGLSLGAAHRGVRVAGRCADLVTIDAGGAEDPVVAISHGGVGLSGLSLAGGTTGLLASQDGLWGDEALDVEGLALSGNVAFGLAVEQGARVRVDGCEVADTLPSEDGGSGWGVKVSGGGVLAGRGLLLQRNHEVGFFASGEGTSVDLEDVAILETEPRPDGQEGRGLSAQGGAILALSGLRVEGSHNVGVIALGEGTEVDLRDAVVTGTRPRPGGLFGRGVEVGAGARLVATGLLVEDNSEFGIFVADGGEVALDLATVSDTRPHPDGMGGAGIEVVGGGRLLATGVIVEGNRDCGLVVDGEGTIVELEDSTIRDTLPQADGSQGAGVEVTDGAGLVAAGLLVEGNSDVGLALSGLGTRATLEGSAVRGTLPAGDGTGGRGIAVQGEAHLVASEVLLEDNCDVGIFAGGDGTILDLDGVTIRGTRPRPDGGGGRGLSLRDGARAGADLLLVEECHEIGLAAVGSGTFASLRDATIRDTRSTGRGRLGRGASVHDGAVLVARGLLVDGSGDAGVVASGPGVVVDLQGAIVRGTRSAADGASGFGLASQYGATLRASGLLVEGCDGPGAYVVQDAELAADSAVFTGNGFAAAVVERGLLSLHGGEVFGSTAHASEGGGAGVFAWDISGPSAIDLHGVAFHDLAGPALYLRGPGRYAIEDCDVTAAGTWPWLPGGLLAVEGVGSWEPGGGDDGTGWGLLLAGNRFVGLASDAVLLDASSATLAPGGHSGSPNAFADLAGDALVWQRCGSLAAPEILDGSVPAASCATTPAALGPLLEYRLWLAEAIVAD